jgi:hypothetical protein
MHDPVFEQERDFSFLQHVKTNCAACSAFCSVDFAGFSAEVRWPGHESDPSPPSCTEVKNGWSCTSDYRLHLHYVHSETFTCILYDQSKGGHCRILFCFCKVIGMSIFLLTFNIITLSYVIYLVA